MTRRRSSASASGVPARKREDRLQFGEGAEGHDGGDGLSPGPSPSGSARAAAPRRRSEAARADAGEEGGEVALDDARELGLGRREAAQELRQALGGGEGGDGERAEQAAAVVEHELEIDLGAVGLAAGRPARGR